MNKKFEAAVKRISLDKGYSDNDATMQFLLERRSDGAYCVDWVAGMHLGWIARGTADAEEPEHSEWHQFTKSEWLVDNKEHDISIDDGCGGQLIIATVGYIDVLHPGGDGFNPQFFYGPESRANAYLMRAAPQMLRALEQVLVHPIGSQHTKEIAQKAVNAALMRLPNHKPETDGDPAEFEAV